MRKSTTESTEQSVFRKTSLHHGTPSVPRRSFSSAPRRTAVHPTVRKPVSVGELQSLLAIPPFNADEMPLEPLAGRRTKRPPPSIWRKEAATISRAHTEAVPPKPTTTRAVRKEGNNRICSQVPSQSTLKPPREPPRPALPIADGSHCSAPTKPSEASTGGGMDRPPATDHLCCIGSTPSEVRSVLKSSAASPTSGSHGSFVSRRRVNIDGSIQILDSILIQLKKLWSRINASHHIQMHYPSSARGEVRLIRHANLTSFMLTKGVSLCQIHRAASRCVEREGPTALYRFHCVAAWWSAPLEAGSRYSSLQHKNLTHLYGVLCASMKTDKELYLDPDFDDGAPFLKCEPAKLLEPKEVCGGVEPNSMFAPTVYLYTRRDECGIPVTPRHGPYVDEPRPIVFGQLITPQSSSLPQPQKRCWSLHETADFLWQAIAGLRYLHKFRLVHGNLKPSNALLSDDGHLTLTDYAVPLFPDVLTVMDSTTAFVSRPIHERRSESVTASTAEVWEHHPYLRIRSAWCVKAPECPTAANVGSADVVSESLVNYFEFLQHFMAPECMVEADGKLYVDYTRVTPASDAYALGVLCYWMESFLFFPYSQAQRLPVGTLDFSDATVFQVDPPFYPKGFYEATDNVDNRILSCNAHQSHVSPYRNLSAPDNDVTGRNEQAKILNTDNGELEDVLRMLLWPDPAERLSLGTVRLM